MNNLIFIGNVLYCTIQLPGYPRPFSLNPIKKRSNECVKNCEKLGLEVISILISKQIKNELPNYTEFKKLLKSGKLFKEEKIQKDINPKYWRLVGNYWYNKLQYKKSAKIEKYHLMHSLKKFGNLTIDKITDGLINKWINSMKDVSEVNTINLRLSYLKSVFNYAIETGKINTNPAKSIKKLQGGNVRSYLLYREEFERNYNFFVNISPNYALYYLALWETGRRPEEVASYKWSDFDKMRMGIHVRPEISKNNKYDFIPISNRLFSQIIIQFDKTGYIFKNSKGMPWIYTNSSGNKINSNNRFNAMLKSEFNSESVIRDTRRGFITRKIRDGHSIENVMLLSGHTTLSSINRYRIASDDEKRKVLDINNEVSCMQI